MCWFNLNVIKARTLSFMLQGNYFKPVVSKYVYLAQLMHKYVAHTACNVQVKPSQQSDIKRSEKTCVYGRSHFYLFLIYF